MNDQAIAPNPNIVEPATVLKAVNRRGRGGGGTGGVYDRGSRTYATGTYSRPYYTVAWGDTQSVGQSSDRMPYYTVAWGDNLTAVAARFGVTVDALVRATNLRSSVIQPGQVLLIPGAGTGADAGQKPSGNAQRVNFAPGAIAANRTGQITHGASSTYVLGARAGQSMEVYTVGHGEPQ